MSRLSQDSHLFRSRLYIRLTSSGILDHSHPVVPTFNLDIRHISGCLTFQRVAVSEKVVVLLQSLERKGSHRQGYRELHN